MRSGARALVLSDAACEKVCGNHVGQIKKIVSKYPPQYAKSGIIPVLDIAQRQHGGWYAQALSL